MKIKPLVVLALSLAAFASVGCKSSGDSAVGDKAPSKNSKFIIGEAPPTEHSFAKLSRGMGTGEVHDLVGEPTDRGGSVTGKSFNPFYYGTDYHHEVWYYKGQGRLTFNNHGRLIEVRYNPDERGYR